VGYFYGIDINLFTLFSLSEHILFSIEAFPFALLAMLFLLSIYFAKIGGDEAAIAVVDRIGPRIQSSPQIRALFEFELPKGLNIIVGYSLMILSVLLSVFWPNPSLTAKFIFMAMTVLGALILGFRIFRSQRVQLIVGALAGLICVFMLGLAIAQSYVAGSKVLHQLLVGSESLNGRIIRSGERGILFVENEHKRVVFIKWDELKRVVFQPN
jgi:hypothetical protein